MRFWFPTCSPGFPLRADTLMQVHVRAIHHLLNHWNRDSILLHCNQTETQRGFIIQGGRALVWLHTFVQPSYLHSKLNKSIRFLWMRVFLLGPLSLKDQKVKDAGWLLSPLCDTIGSSLSSLGNTSHIKNVFFRALLERGRGGGEVEEGFFGPVFLLGKSP